MVLLRFAAVKSCSSLHILLRETLPSGSRPLFNKPSQHHSKTNAVIKTEHITVFSEICM